MTHRRLAPGRLVLATHNAGKVREIRALVEPFGIEPVSAGELGLPVPEETGTTFIENATLKALASATAANLPALADDSGLCVDALGGAPGVVSADWAEAPGRARDFGMAAERVWREVQAVGLGAPISARFMCALVIAWPDGHVQAYEGACEGTIVWPPRGSRGFGYDPIFVGAGMSETFGEIDPGLKHAISHRADAFRKLVADALG
jgi:XTP/dITP diphosphohydrolase